MLFVANEILFAALAPEQYALNPIRYQHGLQQCIWGAVVAQGYVVDAYGHVSWKWKVESLKFVPVNDVARLSALSIRGKLHAQNLTAL